MNSSFPNRWSFSYLKFTKYVTNIIAEPKYKYGQQEQVTTTEVPPWKGQYKNTGGGAGGGFNRFYGIPTSPSASIMAQNIQLFGPRDGFLTHQWITIGKQINHRSPNADLILQIYSAIMLNRQKTNGLLDPSKSYHNTLSQIFFARKASSKMLK